MTITLTVGQWAVLGALPMVTFALGIFAIQRGPALPSREAKEMPYVKTAGLHRGLQGVEQPVKAEHENEGPE
jgi:hypothetical protein